MREGPCASCARLPQSMTLQGMPELAEPWPEHEESALVAHARLTSIMELLHACLAVPLLFSPTCPLPETLPL